MSEAEGIFPDAIEELDRVDPALLAGIGDEGRAWLAATMQPDATPSPAASDEQPDLSDVVRIKGLTIPGATLREWEQTYQRIDVRAELADLSKWVCEKKPEGGRLPVIAGLLMRKNKAARSDFLDRRAAAEAKASAPPYPVEASRYQFLSDTDGNTVPGNSPRAVRPEKTKSRFQI